MQSKRTLGDAYVLETIEKVISIIAKETGFDGIQLQALDYFSNLINAYLDNMFTSAHRLADLNTYFKTQSKDTTVEKLPAFLPSDDEESDEEVTEGGLPSYVPRHLPTFPSKHSFRKTPVYISRPDDPQKVRELNSEQSRTVEENLKKLMSAENDISRQKNEDSTSTKIDSIMNDITIPIVNYEIFIQRRKRQKQSGTTLNVEGANEPKLNNNDSNESNNEMTANTNEFDQDSNKDTTQNTSSQTLT
ncbi:uncharacterized protein BX663DRAFT_437247 [Cokeromyces recurvatus]|uniref:uncharacterized protein n=1 Tax=Cokeromyces recurvatus TaxID=90255 RepID=UPI0022208A10|nr:uncharacterized protein BX663DRAFT_437247 [Cokeromyces recurvatus]KAI7901366.1 hypothetical protein BX663DRAFT_437247 [Cokeromyces recurvatus]